MPDVQDDNPGAERRQDILRAHVAQLAEHFANVQIFASTHIDDDTGTASHQFGCGNWFARYGQVREWCVKQDERARVDARRDCEE